MPIFIYSSSDLLPAVPRRRGRGRCVNPLIDAFDEVELPCPALDLPGAERDEARKKQHRAKRECQPSCHGMFFMSWADGGIMLVLRWYITQIDPLKVMTTSTSVKTSASNDQPPSILVFMCRK